MTNIAPLVDGTIPVSIFDFIDSAKDGRGMYCQDTNTITGEKNESSLARMVGFLPSIEKHPSISSE